MNYEELRSISWIYDILTSGIGLGAFVAVIGILLPSGNDSNTTLEGLLEIDEDLSEEQSNYY